MSNKKNEKAVSDEEIIAALISNRTIKEAAAAVGIADRTIYDRMNDRDFRSAYKWAKTDIIRQAVFSINEKLAAAVESVAEIMNDTNANPAVRLQAAQTIINNAAKFSARLTSEETANREEAKDPLAFDFG